jgi:hypothetical protein
MRRVSESSTAGTTPAPCPSPTATEEKALGSPCGEGCEGRRPSRCPKVPPHPGRLHQRSYDQTRGWFYAQLAISTLMFGDLGTRTGTGKDKKTQPQPQPQLPTPTLSATASSPATCRRRRPEDVQASCNYLPPDEILTATPTPSAGTFRQPAAGTSIRYNEQSIKDSIPEFCPPLECLQLLRNLRQHRRI